MGFQVVCKKATEIIRKTAFAYQLIEVERGRGIGVGVTTEAQGTLCIPWYSNAYTFTSHTSIRKEQDSEVTVTVSLGESKVENHA
jgi:hypothetical protein